MDRRRGRRALWRQVDDAPQRTSRVVQGEKATWIGEDERRLRADARSNGSARRGGIGIRLTREEQKRERHGDESPPRAPAREGSPSRRDGVSRVERVSVATRRQPSDAHAITSPDRTTLSRMRPWIRADTRA